MESIAKTSVTNGYSRIAIGDSTVYFNIGHANFTFADARQGRRFERLVGSSKTSTIPGTRHVVRVEEWNVHAAMRTWIAILEGTL